MKKLIAILLATLTLMSSSASALANTPGERIGDVLHTDIRVFIDGVQIMGFNINGWTYVVAEELNAYGFTVLWNEGERRVDITRGPSTALPIPVPETLEPVGSVAFPYVYTDIQTFMDGVLVHSYNIQGRTVVPIDSLAYMFGDIVWHEEQRELHARIAEDGSVVVQQPVEPASEPDPEPTPHVTATFPERVLPPRGTRIDPIQGGWTSYGRFVIPFGSNDHPDFVPPALITLTDEELERGEWFRAGGQLNREDDPRHAYASWYDTVYRPWVAQEALRAVEYSNIARGLDRGAVVISDVIPRPEGGILEFPKGNIFIDFDIGTARRAVLPSVLPETGKGRVDIFGHTLYLGEHKTSVESRLGVPTEITHSRFITLYRYIFSDGMVDLGYSISGRLHFIGIVAPGFAFGNRAIGDFIDVYNEDDVPMSPGERRGRDGDNPAIYYETGVYTECGIRLFTLTAVYVIERPGTVISRINFSIPNTGGDALWWSGLRQHFYVQ